MGMAGIALGRPLPEGVGRVTQWFGERAAQYLPYGFAGHEGVDYGVPVGTPVLAAADGVVLRAGDSRGLYGLRVVLGHGAAWQTVYAHLSEVRVHVGDCVARGAVIGLSGNTGRSTGPHLHFGLRCTKTQNGSQGFVDPVPYRE